MVTSHTFTSWHDAKEFANLRRMVDGFTVEGPYYMGETYVVHVVNPSTRATASL